MWWDTIVPAVGVRASTMGALPGSSRRQPGAGCEGCCPRRTVQARAWGAVATIAPYVSPWRWSGRRRGLCGREGGDPPRVPARAPAAPGDKCGEQQEREDYGDRGGSRGVQGVGSGSLDAGRRVDDGVGGVAQGADLVPAVVGDVGADQEEQAARPPPSRGAIAPRRRSRVTAVVRVRATVSEAAPTLQAWVAPVEWIGAHDADAAVRQGMSGSPPSCAGRSRPVRSGGTPGGLACRLCRHADGANAMSGICAYGPECSCMTRRRQILLEPEEVPGGSTVRPGHAEAVESPSAPRRSGTALAA